MYAYAVKRQKTWVSAVSMHVAISALVQWLSPLYVVL